MSSLTNRPDGLQALSNSVLTYSKSSDPQPSNKQQLKQDALELAELIYNIYNSNCPVSSSSIRQEGKSDD